MFVNKTIVAMVIPVVCGFASSVSANDIPSMGRTGNFDYTVCGGFPIDAQQTAVPTAFMGGTNLGMSANVFCECVKSQVGESVREKIECGAAPL